MKVICIDNKDLPCDETLVQGKVYKVIRTMGDNIVVRNEEGDAYGYNQDRFMGVNPFLFIWRDYLIFSLFIFGTVVAAVTVAIALVDMVAGFFR
jgi:hypothetical protein